MVTLRFIAKTITANGVFEKGQEVTLPREDADKIIGLSSVKVVEGLKRKKRKKEKVDEFQ